MKAGLQEVKFTYHTLGSYQCAVALRRSAQRIPSLFDSFRLDCCFLLNVLPSSTSASFRVPYQLIHFWPLATFLTICLATFSFLLSFCLYEKRVNHSGDVEDCDLLVYYSEWQGC